MSQPLRLPEDLDRHAKRCDALYNHVLNAMRAADGIVQDSLYFFPEYTDHGKDHVQAVWSAAFGLIPPDAKGNDGPFTADDACILALAVLLHDIAMHLHLEGFKRLIAEGAPWCLDGEDVDAPCWSQMWRDYLIEAGRWDGDRITKVLGDGVTVVPRIDLSQNDLSKSERMLVGEFLRRHHPRLAHEIARHGFPDAKGAKPILDGVDRHYANLAGLIARSHGMALRDCLDRLRRAGRHREFKGIHALYLMALLRVADYVQLQADRAPADTLRQFHMASRVSRLEWKTHAAILDIRESDDAEALIIEIEPEDVHALLRAKEWVEGLQEELDKSWAALGEIYGTRQPLCLLGLRFRRVHALVTEGLPFHPVHARFRLAGSDTIKLLIGPLYGHRPAVGIRELMQNAVDAVRERQLVEQENGNLGWAGEAEFDVEIRIELDEEDQPVAVVVRDIGMGMTADIVLNYFLTAGATFRRSDAWRDRFEEKPGADGTPGRVKVLRAGRFGVGALAAFLIGDEIEVTTRHRDAPEDEGIHFVAHVNDDAIQLDRLRCTDVGTTIRVKIGAGQRWQIARLTEEERWVQWDWFCHSQPRVGRFVGNGAALPQTVCVTEEWFTFGGTPYDSVSWQPVRVEGRDGQINCNGIKVCDTDRTGWHVIWGNLTGVRTPDIDVVDRCGELRLTMTRDALDGGRNLIEAVMREMVLHIIADALANGISQRWKRYVDEGVWAMTAGGAVIAVPALFEPLAVREVWLLPDSLELEADAEVLTKGRLVVTTDAHMAMEIRDGNDRVSFISEYEYKSDRWAKVAEDGKFMIHAVEGYVYPYAELLNYIKGRGLPHLEAAVCDASIFRTSGELVADVWLDLIGPRPIPLDPMERRAALPEAFKQLAPLIEYYAKLGPLRG